MRLRACCWGLASGFAPRRPYDLHDCILEASFFLIDAVRALLRSDKGRRAITVAFSHMNMSMQITRQEC